jgi:hypothetical protein
MIGGHILLQIDVGEHRRLGIGGAHHDRSCSCAVLDAESADRSAPDISAMWQLQLRMSPISSFVFPGVISPQPTCASRSNRFFGVPHSACPEIMEKIRHFVPTLRVRISHCTACCLPERGSSERHFPTFVLLCQTGMNTYNQCDPKHARPRHLFVQTRHTPTRSRTVMGIGPEAISST